MSHVADKVILQFREFPLPHHKINCYEECDKQYQGKYQCKENCIGNLQHIPVQIREMDTDQPHPSCWIVTEECLCVTILFASRVIVRTSVNLPAFAIKNSVMKYQIDTVVPQRTADALHQEVLVYTLLERLFTRCI